MTKDNLKLLDLSIAADFGESQGWGSENAVSLVDEKKT